ncbi:MAG: hypothetical protein P8177_11080 [Gemmatimonadota bacterium]|jgi:hypothetical protein
MKRLCLSIAAASLLAAPAAAQDDLLNACAAVQPISSPEIPGGVPFGVTQQFQYLCGQVVGAAATVQPVLGIAYTGGSHTLGTASTIGRRLGFFPRIAVTVRANGAFADVPDLLDEYVPRFEGDGQLSTMGQVGVPVAALQGDVTLGLFNGLTVGPTFGGLGAIDLLGSVSYVPTSDEVGLDEGIVNVGIGARVGILRQGLVMPGVSVSGLYRTTLDDAAFGSLQAGDPAEFSSNLSMYSFRLGVSKGLLMLDLAAGAGYDIYTSDVAFDWRLDCPPSECGQAVTLGTPEGVSGELSTAAWNVHGSAGLSFVLVNIVGEVGYQKATTVVDAASLGQAGLPARDPATEALQDGRIFASIGIRLSM